MSNRINDELLSAYLDGEVTAAERAEVEKALAESPELRISLESLRQVQARLQSVPRLSLPEDFSERVWREAERRMAATAVAASTVGSASSVNWMRLAAMAATVAAVLIVAVVIVANRQTGDIVHNGAPDDSDPVAGGSLAGTPREGGPIEGGPAGTEVERQNPPPPGAQQTVPVSTKRPAPLYIMVLDLVITKEGQEQRIFAKALSDARISYDSNNLGVSLNEDLRNDLLGTRIAAEVDQPNENRANEPFDIVDMVYVQGTVPQLDSVFLAMKQHNEAHALLDMAIDPKTQGVLNAIGERAWSLAQIQFPDSPISHAYRLDLKIVLHSSRGVLGKLPTLGLKAQLVPQKTKGDPPANGLNAPPPPDAGGNPARPEKAGANPANAEPDYDNQICEMLVIIRNLTDDAPVVGAESAGASR